MRLLILLLCMMLTSCSTLSSGTTEDDTITLSVPTVFTPSTKSAWANVIQTIEQTKAKTIVLLWEGRGGWFIIGEPVKRALRKVRAEGKTVILKITGPALSLHAYMACEASRIEYTDNGVLMFHVAEIGRASCRERV